MKYNRSQIVNLPFGKDNKWFVNLFDSIISVDYHYIKYDIRKIEIDSVPEVIEMEDHLERVFAYELYRQWMNKLESLGINTIVVNGEIGKCLKDDINHNINKDKKEGKNVFPDLVLHESQGNDNNQLMICEIKREKGLEDSFIFGDLLKLSCYLCKCYFWKKPFKYGVFILEGENASLTKLKIKNGCTSKFIDTEITIDEYKDNKYFKATFSNIVCVSYDGTNLEYELLKELLDKIISED